MRRGDVYWAGLVPRSGSEQTGRRPAVIVSHDGFNQTATWMSIIVVPISTSTKQGKRTPTAVELPKGAGGLPTDSLAVCHQVTTLDRTKLTKKLGALTPELLHRIDEAIKAALSLD